MKIGIIGLGFVGLTTALSLANKKFKIVGYDTDHEKIKNLDKKKLPFYEEKLDKVLSNNSSVGIIPIMGTPSSIKAIGPCFNSPAAYASACK